MPRDKGKIYVYYDGACPQRIRDRQTYDKLAGIEQGAHCCFGIGLSFAVSIIFDKFIINYSEKPGQNCFKFN